MKNFAGLCVLACPSPRSPLETKLHRASFFILISFFPIFLFNTANSLKPNVFLEKEEILDKLMANLLLQLDQTSKDSFYTTDTLTNVGLFSILHL